MVSTLRYGTNVRIRWSWVFARLITCATTRNMFMELIEMFDIQFLLHYFSEQILITLLSVDAVWISLSQRK
jgi:hypothetical protein